VLEILAAVTAPVYNDPLWIDDVKTAVFACNAPVVVTLAADSIPDTVAPDVVRAPQLTEEPEIGPMEFTVAPLISPSFTSAPLFVNDDTVTMALLEIPATANAPVKDAGPDDTLSETILAAVRVAVTLAAFAWILFGVVIPADVMVPVTVKLVAVASPTFTGPPLINPETDTSLAVSEPLELTPVAVSRLVERAPDVKSPVTDNVFDCKLPAVLKPAADAKPLNCPVLAMIGPVPNAELVILPVDSDALVIAPEPLTIPKLVIPATVMVAELLTPALVIPPKTRNVCAVMLAAVSEAAVSDAPTWIELALIF